MLCGLQHGRLERLQLGAHVLDRFRLLGRHHDLADRADGLECNVTLFVRRIDQVGDIMCMSARFGTGRYGILGVIRSRDAADEYRCGNGSRET